ncbi:replication-associated protein [Pacific flying fox faeces associated circular DNA virus-15]|nr:replication-associated protein [Pacific flying fox faeces associated circular DNA virus-15]
MDTFLTAHQEEEPRYPGSDVEDDSLLCLEGPLSPEDETLEAPKEKPKSEKKKGSFRLRGTQFILTFPQCDVKKEVAAERIDIAWGKDLTGYVVCEENHKDGTPHLHVYLKFENRKSFSKVDCFDFIGQKHGNYQVVRSTLKSIEYVTKGGNYVAKGVDVESIKKKKAPKNQEIAKMLLDGKSMAEINEDHCGYVMINKRKIEEYETWVKCEKIKKSKIDWIPPSLDGLTDANLQIATWICSNIRQNRAFKAPQLYIHGPRNLGKTSLVEWLERSLSVYHMPTMEDFYDLYSDDYDLVVIDEFKGQKTIQFLNQFLQGSVMPIRKKGSQGDKSKNLPVVILSNYTLSECYVKAANDGRLNTLECRLEIVEVDSFIDFYKDRNDLI